MGYGAVGRKTGSPSGEGGTLLSKWQGFLTEILKQIPLKLYQTCCCGMITRGPSLFVLQRYYGSCSKPLRCLCR